MKKNGIGRGPETIRRWVAGALPILVLAMVSQAAPWQGRTPAGKPAVRKLRYNQDIRPILAENCFPCHGPDSAARKANLRLDRFADAVADHDGRAAIVPGDVLRSEMVRRILKPENDPLRMPPVSGHKALTPEQKKTLLLWIDQGAEYEKHWSYIPPKRPALPVVKNTRWVRNSIDRFVLARLEAAGLTPAPEADRRTLARRLSLDLIGLPPDPVEVERFVADTSPNYYEKYVDKLLANPHWGEHRGRFWLDAARYGDTHGIHIDNFREIWAYRDWVIDAFNRNLPFDRFTIEQLAGDLLPKPTLNQLVATGFTRCNITTSEGGAIDEEYLVLYNRDRTETASQVWMGTTAGCAVCHDHKFDPLSQKEFYSLAAFFNNTTQRAMDGNVKDTPPIIPVPTEQDRPRYAALPAEIEAARAKRDERKTAAAPVFEAWKRGADSLSLAVSLPTDGMTVYLPLEEGKGSQVSGTAEASPVTAKASADPDWTEGIVSAKAFQKKPGSELKFPDLGDRDAGEPFSCAVWVKLAPNGGSGAILARMDESRDFRGWDLWIEGNRVGSHLIHKWPDDALKVVTREALTPGKWQHVVMTYDGGKKKESIRFYVDGVEKPTDPQSDTLKGTTKSTVPLAIGQRNTSAAVEGTGIQDVRLFRRVLTPEEVGRLTRGTPVAKTAALLARAREGTPLTEAEQADLFTYYLSNADPEYPALTANLNRLEEEKTRIEKRGTIAHIAVERKEPPVAYVLYRGEYDKRREQVKPETPTALPPMPADLPRNRLGFARWLLLPEHPLTARVTVNRYWQEVFGTGLVRSSGDFGIMGELPSHPELLDWLALEYRAIKWDTKRFFKMLVTSATYRQATVTTPVKRLKDPANRLLSRGPRFRMDAEMIRDYALAASGLLVPKLGGPSVRPYQPPGVWEAVAMPGSDTRDYKQDTGEKLYRRSMYTFWKRSAPPASMEIFNAPSREVCTMRRERTNTPLQALVTMNDVQFVEAARRLAERAVFLDGGDTDAERADFVARRLMARPLLPEEKTVVLKSLADLEAYYRLKPEEANRLIRFGESEPLPILPKTQLAAWTMIVNQLMNLDEVLNK
ncbi:MAG: DUF1553 domain-containing protein [Capsulimonadales bacterium]|nr:DUF1553 domain-containing protein [Capsulimonadales bacterium]